jgi:hypothetical protein
MSLESRTLSYSATACNYWPYDDSVACIKKSSRPARGANEMLLEHARSRSALTRLWFFPHAKTFRPSS